MTYNKNEAMYLTISLQHTFLKYFRSKFLLCALIFFAVIAQSMAQTNFNVTDSVEISYLLDSFKKPLVVPKIRKDKTCTECIMSGS